MTDFVELQSLSFKQTENLKVDQGLICADIATWVQLDTPQTVTKGRLFLRYFAGQGYKELPLDELVHPIKPQALLASRIKLPLELRNVDFTLCLAIEGSSFHVDTTHIAPMQKQRSAKRSANKAYFAA